MLQPYPHGTPTDAELQAQRDADHARVVAEYYARNGIHEDWPVTEVIG
jgi:hypothetical protein